MNSLLRRLRRQRIDGRSDDETMQGAANVIEALEAQIAERDNELAALRERVAELERVLDGYRGQVDRFGNSPAGEVLGASASAGTGET